VSRSRRPGGVHRAAIVDVDEVVLGLEQGDEPDGSRDPHDTFGRYLPPGAPAHRAVA
jgi:hypothetical protein